MRRMVVIGLVGGAAVAAAVVVASRRPLASTLAGEPDWAPLSLTGPRVDRPVAPRAEASAAAAAATPATTAPPSATSPSAWVAPDIGGGCPGSHPVKSTQSSRIYHVPGGLFYERTRAGRCYCDAAAAEADGYRAAKR